MASDPLLLSVWHNDIERVTKIHWDYYIFCLIRKNKCSILSSHDIWWDDIWSSASVSVLSVHYSPASHKHSLISRLITTTASAPQAHKSGKDQNQTKTDSLSVIMSDYCNKTFPNGTSHLAMSWPDKWMNQDELQSLSLTFSLSKMSFLLL